MRDITLEDTFRHQFTTRAFATGIPTVLAGTPVLSVLEENNATPITAGVTVSVDRASVVGLNEVTVIATAANGYESGKSYAIYISTGTVGGTSVIGEIVGQFTIELAAAFTRLGAPAGASVSADIAGVPTVAEFNARTLIAASYFDPAADAVANVTLVATTTANTDMRGTDSGLLAASAPTNFGDLVITVTTGLVSVGTNNDKSGYSISGTITTLDGLNNFAPATDAVANVTLVATTTTNTDQRGTDNAALATVLGTPVGADIAADIAAVKADTVIPEKNVAFSNIYVLMVDSTDHVTPKTGLTLTAQRSIDGAAFGAVTGTAAEISNGIYQFDASAADMNGDTITFRFSGTAADDTFLTIVTR